MNKETDRLFGSFAKYNYTKKIDASNETKRTTAMYVCLHFEFKQTNVAKGEMGWRGRTEKRGVTI